MLKRRCVVVILTLLLKALLSSHVGGESVPFSGLYRPSLHFQPDDQAGAFLVKKNRIIAAVHSKIHSVKHSSRIHTDESAIDVILREDCPSCLNFQTRDFLDFFVETLSTTVEQLQPSQRQIANHFVKSSKATANALKQTNTTACPDRRLNETMAVLVFNSQLSGRISTRMKLSFFQATFWSVYRYYKQVTVMTKSLLDYETVLGLGLPQKEVINLNVATQHDVPNLNYNLAAMLTQGKLVKESLDHMAVNWRGSPTWSAFQYVYFSLGDQLLHARRFADLYDALDVGVEGNFLLAPHRMQTLPLAQSFSSAQQDAFWPAPSSATGAVGAFLGALTSSSADGQTSSRSTSAQWQPHAKVVTESLAQVSGSCCEQGRVMFPSCLAVSPPRRHRITPLAKGSKDFLGNNNTTDVSSTTRAENAMLVSRLMAERIAQQDWAGCTEWGARNFSSWLRVGPDGFSMPPVTVHLAHCAYSPSRQLCPLPVSTANTHVNRNGSSGGNCASRLPQTSPVSNNGTKTLPKAPYLHCTESPVVRFDASTQHMLDPAVRAALKLGKPTTLTPTPPPKAKATKLLRSTQSSASKAGADSPSNRNKRVASTWSIVF